jgi:hypothetical protein
MFTIQNLENVENIKKFYLLILIFKMRMARFIKIYLHLVSVYIQTYVCVIIMIPI